MAVIMDCEFIDFRAQVKMLISFSSCENIVLWRGHFNATGQEKFVNLSINGGEGKAFLYHLYNTLTHTKHSICRECLGEQCVFEHFFRKVSSTIQSWKLGVD